MSHLLLKKSYESVLLSINNNDFILGADLYSGVFLSAPTVEYQASSLKVMVVGRETAGWNTKTKLNSISLIAKQNEAGKLEELITGSFERYRVLLDKLVGKTSTSSFQRYLLAVARALKVAPQSLMYQNLYAWDYNDGSPAKRPKSEFAVIQRLSAQLLAASIKYNRPDAIVFSCGCNKTNDQTIKMVCQLLTYGHFDDLNLKGFDSVKCYETKEIEKKRYWRFRCDGIECIRISHPRAQGCDFFRYRTMAINALAEMSDTRSVE